MNRIEDIRMVTDESLPPFVEGAISLGVDGGAGTLRFALRRSGSTQVTHYECLGANLNLVGRDAFVSRLTQGLHDALAQIGAAPEDITSAGLGLSGVDRPDDIESLREKLKLVMPNATRLWIGNDALPALRQGGKALRGLVLIAGTGSICVGIANTGEQVRVGGWGGDLGDEGSGFWIGLRGLQAACRMADGRLERTDLLKRILKATDVKTAPELIPWTYSKSRAEFKQAVSQLFPIVMAQSTRGDQTARQAVLLGIGHLIQHVLACERKLREVERLSLAGIETQTVEFGDPDTLADDLQPKLALVCAGGLFSGNQDFYDMFVHHLGRKKNSFEPTRLTQPSSLGSLSLGEEMHSFSGVQA